MEIWPISNKNGNLSGRTCGIIILGIEPLNACHSGLKEAGWRLPLPDGWGRRIGSSTTVAESVIRHLDRWRAQAGFFSPAETETQLIGCLVLLAGYDKFKWGTGNKLAMNAVRVRFFFQGPAVQLIRISQDRDPPHVFFSNGVGHWRCAYHVVSLVLCGTCAITHNIQMCDHTLKLTCMRSAISLERSLYLVTCSCLFLWCCMFFSNVIGTVVSTGDKVRRHGGCNTSSWGVFAAGTIVRIFGELPLLMGCHFSWQVQCWAHLCVCNLCFPCWHSCAGCCVCFLCHLCGIHKTWWSCKGRWWELPVHLTLPTPYSTHHTPHSTLYTVALHTPHSTLHALYSAL